LEAGREEKEKRGVPDDATENEEKRR